MNLHEWPTSRPGQRATAQRLIALSDEYGYPDARRPMGAHRPEVLGWRAIPVATILARFIAADRVRVLGVAL